MTNLIQQDIIRRGLNFAKVTDNNFSPSDSVGKKYTVDLYFRDGSQKQLIIYQRFTKTNYRIEGCDQDDSFYIEYGVPENNQLGLVADMVRYELPNLGQTKGHFNNGRNTFVTAAEDGKCYDNEDGSGSERVCVISKDFQINNIMINISNEADPEVESHVLSIYIGFYHPNLGTKYAINIITPVDYQSSSMDAQGKFPIDLTNPQSTTGIYYPTE